MSNLKQKLKALIKCREAALNLVKSAEKQMDEINLMISGDKPDFDQAKKIKSQRFSYGVYFTRRQALRQVRCKGLVNKSLRRFVSPKEANQHGKRFTKIHNHKGYKVVKLQMRANAWINWITGKTNPVIG